MSLLCIKLRSFLRLLLHSDCLSSPPPPPPPPTPAPPSQPDATSGRRQQEQKQELPTGSANGSKALQGDAAALLVDQTSIDGEPPHHGPAHHLLLQQQRSTRARSSPEDASAILVPSSCAASTKPVQNIYRKPMSRFTSNPSLRRSREHHLRCNQRLSRHVQLWDSDPGDVIYYYSPPGSTQLHVASPTQSQVEEDPQVGQDYRRRVYTMPSAVPLSGPDVPRGGSGRRKTLRSLETKGETALGRNTPSPKVKQLLMYNTDDF